MSCDCGGVISPPGCTSFARGYSSLTLLELMISTSSLLHFATSDSSLLLSFVFCLTQIQFFPPFSVKYYNGESKNTYRSVSADWLLFDGLRAMGSAIFPVLVGKELLQSGFCGRKRSYGVVGLLQIELDGH